MVLMVQLACHLLERILQVKYDGTRSTPFRILLVVLQGSDHSNLLFNLFVNNIGIAIGSRIVIFDDDLKMFDIDSAPAGHRNLQRSLDSVMNIGRNVTSLIKCVVMS